LGNNTKGRIKLTKNSITGCKDSTILDITINPIPSPVIQGTNNTCQGSIEVYKAPITNGLKNEWQLQVEKYCQFYRPK